MIYNMISNITRKRDRNGSYEKDSKRRKKHKNKNKKHDLDNKNNSTSKRRKVVKEDILCNLFNISLNQVKDYIDKNNRRPSSTDKNKNIKQLGQWVCHQQKNYQKKVHIMSNPTIYDQWTEFTTSDKYKEYFLLPEDQWTNSLNQVKDYIDKNNKRPSQHDKNKDIKQLGQWIGNQQKNYKKKKKSMSNPTIYDQWTEFTTSDKYKEYFMLPEDQWINSFNQVKDYIDENNKKPSTKDKNKDIKQLGQWISTQQKNYQKKAYIMSNSTIYDQWTEFTTSDKYKEYFKNFNKKNNIKKQIKEKCVHKWKVIKDDDYYNYKECEKCKMKSKESRLGKEQGYNEPNPDKKKEINNWFTEQKYINGKAIILDAIGLKTSTELIESNKFMAKDIIIPEYDEKTFQINSKHELLGECLRNGDYLEILKEIKPDKLSLIYADFTGSYKIFVKPLLQYLESIELREGVVIGITWSNNGVGDKNKRSRIIRELGKYEEKLNIEEIENSPTENGYGDGGCMNVIFYKKINK